MVTRLVLIRHAHVDTGARLCGSFDAPLSPAGRRQLLVLLPHLSSSSAPEALYTSTLARAREVAVAFGRVWRLEPRLTDAVREIDCGRFEGLPLKELQQAHPDVWARNEAQADDTFAWPGGESYRQFRERVLAGFDAIATAHPGQRVAIVTHAGVISQVLGTIRGRCAAAWAPDRPAPLTATEVAWKDGAPRALLTYNDPDWPSAVRPRAG